MMNRPRPPPPPPSPPGSIQDDDDLPPFDDDEAPPFDEDEPPPPGEDFDDPPPDGEPPMDDDNEEDFEAPPLDDEPPMDDEDDDAPPPPLDDIEEEDEEPPFEEDDDEPPLDDEDNPPIYEIEDDEEEPPPLPAESPVPSPTSSPSHTPLEKSKSNFVLPVRKTASIVNTEEETVGSKYSGSLDLSSLNAGLTIPPAPQLLKKAVAPPNPPPSTTSQGSGVEGAEVSDLTNTVTKDGDTKEAVRQRALELGYVPAMGKFDVDPFEPLFVKIESADKRLLVLVETGQELAFDLSIKAYVFEDTAEENTIVLDYHKTIIIFKFTTTETLISFMKHMPEEVFMAPTPDELEEVVETGDKNKNKKAQESKKSPPKTPRPGPKIEHVKGTSVEDILENDFGETAERQEKIDQMFFTRGAAPTAAANYPPAPQRRKELVESHIRKPKYSVRRVTLLCEWVNSLHIWPHRLGITTLHREMCNGLLLARIVQVLCPNVQFLHLNEKPLAKKAALDNLDQALGHIWRAKSLNNSRIPSGEDVYAGKTSKIAVLINELYSVYVIKPLYKNIMKVLKWYNAVLKQYSRPLPSYVLEEGDLSGVWPHFQSGTALFCILYHFFGPSIIGQGNKMQRVDPLQVCGDPTSICDYRDNLVYAFSLLDSLNIDVLWTVEDWISFPDTEFILLQLFFIYEKLKNKQCSLPPAQGNAPGLTSGPGGELLVVGLVFKDAPLNAKYLPKTHKAVLLGYDHDSMPLLPIDKVIKDANHMRFAGHGVLPAGMTHGGVARISQVSKELKESRIHVQKGDWNARTKVSLEKETFVGANLVNLLRERHKVTEAPAGAGASSGDSVAPSTNASVRGYLGQQATKMGVKPMSTFKSEPIGNLMQVDTNLGTVGPAGRNNASSPTSPTQHVQFEAINKEIDQLVRALEDEMNLAQNQLLNTEEQLASRYAELEESAMKLTIEEYEMHFNHLEAERIELEQERARVQDYFMRKMEAIRVKRDDMYKQSFAHQQLALNELSQNVQASSALNLSQLTTKGKAKKMTEKSGPKSKEESEKGWIKLSSAKMDTHNYLLRQKQMNASAKFQAKITPHKLLVRETKTATSPTKTMQNEGAEVDSPWEKALGQTYVKPKRPLSAEEAVQDSFDRFKQRLRLQTDKWHASRNKTRPRLMDFMTSGTKALPTNEHAQISLPEKSYAPAAMTKEEMSFSRALRDTELQCMFYEDERRRMVLVEQSLQQSLQDTSLFQTNPSTPYANQNAFNTPASPAEHAPASPGPWRADEPSSPHGQPSAVEIDAAYRWLSASRPLILCERNSKEYVFSLVDQIGANSSTGVHRKGFTQYAFQWREFSPYTAEEVLAGSALLGDIASLSASPVEADVFTIALQEHNRALKNSRGRIVLTVRCGSPNDCLKYFNAFTILLAVR